MARRARRDLAELFKSERNSNKEMRRLVARGLAHGVFSADRVLVTGNSSEAKAHQEESKTNSSGSASKAASGGRVADHIAQLIERQKRISEAEEAKTERVVTRRVVEVVSDDPSKRGRHTVSLTNGPDEVSMRAGGGDRNGVGLEVNVATAHWILRQQRTLLSSDEAQTELEKARLAVGYEEARFLHRLRDLRPRLVAPLLESLGLDVSHAGYRQLERAIGRHLADDRSIAQAMKENMQLVMGDVWDE